MSAAGSLSIEYTEPGKALHFPTAILEHTVGIGIDGIATGIDTTALIGALTEAASGPKNSLLARIDDYEDKNEKITELINLIGDMEDSLEDIEDVKAKWKLANWSPQT